MAVKLTAKEVSGQRRPSANEVNREGEARKRSNADEDAIWGAKADAAVADGFAMDEEVQALVHRFHES